MANYTQLARATAKKVLEPYSLGEIHSFSVIAGGAENSSFLVGSDGGDCVLTVYTHKSLASVQLLAEVLETLMEHNFPSTPLRHTANGPVSVFQGKAVLVKDYIHGEVCHPFSEDMCVQLGRRLAQLHNIDPPAGLPTQHGYGLSMFSVAGSGADEDSFHLWLSQKASSLASAIPHDLPTVFAHGDAFYDNIIFRDGQLAALIDFEETAQLPAVFDLGMAALGTCFQGSRLNLTRLSALRSGYHQCRQLSATEAPLLQVMIEYAAVATAFWRQRQYRVVKPDPQRWDRHLEMVARADAVAAMSAGVFLPATSSRVQ